MRLCEGSTAGPRRQEQKKRERASICIEDPAKAGYVAMAVHLNRVDAAANQEWRTMIPVPKSVK